jgi:hypothetical protein
MINANISLLYKFLQENRGNIEDEKVIKFNRNAPLAWPQHFTVLS